MHIEQSVSSQEYNHTNQGLLITQIELKSF
jgi:hypothetical protein